MLWYKLFKMVFYELLLPSYSLKSLYMYLVYLLPLLSIYKCGLLVCQYSNSCKCNFDMLLKFSIECFLLKMKCIEFIVCLQGHTKQL